ncbi:hypothetical protein ASD42_08520 [Nocardia sp. Root136]|uniref:hypothetical protein n=1 Tax=Nocardia sp. Root136 TaxID=1736458 RepID=UPI0006FA7808|nr:hypothetical protein [Nocardia sp. Root136]KQY38450.1 hypothetical protein ASD42_08520 [Nocardia sp. Root136]
MAPDHDADRLSLPIDIDVLIAFAEADGPEVDAESAAAGARIAARLLRGGSAAVGDLDARRAAMAVPGWTVQPLAASSEGETTATRAVQKQLDRELGIEFTRSPAGAEQTRISVHSFGARAAAGDIVRVAVSLGAERTELLVVLYAEADGTLTGQVVTRALTMSEDLEISLLPGAALGSTHTSAVTDAVRCSLTAGRNAWRRVAKGLPAGDPVRAAIVAGLS